MGNCCLFSTKRFTSAKANVLALSTQVTVLSFTSNTLAHAKRPPNGGKQLRADVHVISCREE